MTDLRVSGVSSVTCVGVVVVRVRTNLTVWVKITGIIGDTEATQLPRIYSHDLEQQEVVALTQGRG